MLRNRAPDRFAEGRAKGLNAVGQMELKRLKKQWREEYERERAQGGEARVFASIDAKIAFWNSCGSSTRVIWKASTFAKSCSLNTRVTSSCMASAMPCLSLKKV